MLYLGVREQKMMKDRQNLVDGEDIKLPPEGTIEPSSPSDLPPPSSPAPVIERTESVTVRSED